MRMVYKMTEKYQEKQIATWKVKLQLNHLKFNQIIEKSS